MSVKFVVNTEEAGNQKYYSVSGKAGYHQFYRYGKYNDKKQARKAIKFLSGWDKVNKLTDKEIKKHNALSPAKKMELLKKLCGEK